MNLEYIFPTPIWSFDFNFDLLILENYSYSLKKISDGRQISNYGGWQSEEFFIENESNIEVKKLFSRIKKCIQLCSLEYGFSGDAKLDNYWFNINSPNSFNKEHVHSGCFLSGCFYIKVPDNSGNIIFKRNQLEDYIISSNIGLSTSKLAASMWKYTPYPNKLFVFPGWLPHEVEVNNSNNDRISIAFNVKI